MKNRIALLHLSLVAVGCIDPATYPPLGRQYLIADCDAGRCVARVFVDPSATGIGSGDSWEDAYTSLAQGLEHLIERLSYSEEPAGPAELQIWLTSGPHGSAGSATLQPSSSGYTSISILGGFRGDEAQPTDRDPQAMPAQLTRTSCGTMISGRTGPEGALTIDAIAATGGGCGSLLGIEVRGSAAISRSSFEGFERAVRIDGQGTVEVASTMFGGNEVGLQVSEASSVTIEGGVFLDNELGLEVSSATTETSCNDTRFEDNRTGLQSAGPVTVQGGRFDSNTTVGLSAGGVVTMEDAAVVGNEVGVEAHAGAHVIDSNLSLNGTAIASEGLLKLQRCTFANNASGVVADDLDVRDVSFNGDDTGLRCWGNSRVEDATFVNTDIGINSTGDLEVYDSQFSNNRWGIYCRDGAVGVLRGTFTGNERGLFVSSTATLDRTTLVISSTFSSNGTAIQHGGDVPGTFYDLFIEDSSFNGNGTGINGTGDLAATGAVFTGNTARAIQGSGFLYVGDSQFVSNTGTYGGAILWGGVAGVVLSSSFTDNRALPNTPGFHRGGAIDVSSDWFAVVSTIFYGNGVDSTEATDGGAICAVGTDLEVINTVFWSNEADRGAALAVFNASSGAIGSAALHFVTFANLGGQEYYGMSGVLTRTNTIRLVGGLGCTPCPPPPEPGETDDAGNCWALAASSPCPASYPGACTQPSACASKGVLGILPPDTYDLDGDGNTSEALPLDIAGNPRVNGLLDPGAYEL